MDSVCSQCIHRICLTVYATRSVPLFKWIYIHSIQNSNFIFIIYLYIYIYIHIINTITNNTSSVSYVKGQLLTGSDESDTGIRGAYVFVITLAICLVIISVLTVVNLLSRKRLTHTRVYYIMYISSFVISIYISLFLYSYIYISCFLYIYILYIYAYIYLSLNRNN